MLVRVKAGNPPDIAIVPQPGLLKQLVATGKAVEAPKATADNVDKYFGSSWKDLGSVDGKFYAGPNSANVKSLVWYSPKTFADNGWAVPTTLDELKTLSDKIVASGKMKPWCAGIGSGDATGWPVTDWMEDMMLRLYGPDTYDKWVNHTIPFNGPESTAALDAVGEYLKNDAYVNGGIGNVKSIATTTFQNGGLPILHQQVRNAQAGELLRHHLAQGHDGCAGRAASTRSTSRTRTPPASRSSVVASSCSPSPTSPRCRPSRPSSRRRTTRTCVRRTRVRPAASSARTTAFWRPA